MTASLRADVEAIGEENIGFKSYEIGTHSLHSGAAMTMYVFGPNPSLHHHDEWPLVQWHLPQNKLNNLATMWFKEWSKSHVHTHFRNWASGLTLGPTPDKSSWKCRNKKECWWQFVVTCGVFSLFSNFRWSLQSLTLISISCVIGIDGGQK